MRKLKIRIFTLSFIVTLAILQFSVLNFNVDGLQINPFNTLQVNAVADAYEDDDSFGTAKDIAINTAQERTVFPIADQDYAKFELDSFYLVTIETSGISGDTRLWLYDYAYNIIAFDDDGGTNLFSKIEAIPDSSPKPDYLNPGIYYIRVDDFANDEEIENYTLSLSATNIDPYGSDCGSAVNMGFNSSYQRSIEPSEDIDIYTFTLTSVYNITLETSAAGSGGGDTVMGVCTDCGDYENTKIDEDDDGGANGYSKIVLINLTPGTYYVLVWAYSISSIILNYTLTFTVSNNTVVDNQGPSISTISHYPSLHGSSSSLTVGVHVTDTWGVVDAHFIYSINSGPWVKTKMYRTHSYAFCASVGPLDIGDEVRYFFNATDNSVNHNIATNDNGGSFYSFTVISNDAQDLFEKDNAIAYARTMVLNSTQARRINPIGDIDIISFTIVEELDVSIGTSGITGDTILTLYHDNLTEIATNDNAGSGEFSLIEEILNPGNYLVTVIDEGNDDTITSYDLSLTAIEIPPPIIDNQEPSIVLISPEAESTQLPATFIVLNITDNYGVATVEYNWDDNPNTTVALPIDGILILEFFEPIGIHILKIYVTDIYDNVGFASFIFYSGTLSYTSPTGYPFLLIIIPTFSFIVIIFKRNKKREL